MKMKKMIIATATMKDFERRRFKKVEEKRKL